MCTPSPSRFVPGSGRESRRFAAGSGAKVPQEPTLDDLLVPCHRAESGPRIGVSTKPDSSLQSTHHYFELWKIPTWLLHTISVLSSAANCFPIVDAASQRPRYELFAELALTEPARASDWASVIRTGGRCTVWGERTTDAAHPHLIVPRLVVGSLRCRLRAMASLGPRCPGQSGRCCNVRSGRH